MFIVAGRPILLLNGSGPDHEPKPPIPSGGYFNPGGVLEILPPVIPYRIDFSGKEGVEVLHTQFDVLLSEKKRFLSRASDYLAEVRPYHEAFQSAMASLKEEGFSVKYIQPILIASSELATSAEDASRCSDERSFKNIGRTVREKAFGVKFMQLKFSIALCEWAGMDTTYYVGNWDATRKEMTDEGMQPPSPYSREDVITTSAASLNATVDDLLAHFSIRHNGQTLGDEPAQERAPALSEIDREMRKVFASVMNHRIGNLAGGPAFYQTFYGDDMFGSEYNADRGRQADQSLAMMSYLKFMESFINNVQGSSLHGLVEMAQLRVPNTALLS